LANAFANINLEVVHFPVVAFLMNFNLVKTKEMVKE